MGCYSMSKYPEHDGLETSDEVLDALRDVAAQEGIDFMQLWEDGYTNNLSTDDVVSRIQQHIIQNVAPDDLAEQYYWGRDTIIHIPQKHDFSISGYEAIERTVTSANKSSGRIYLPNAWIGKRVMVVRLE